MLNMFNLLKPFFEDNYLEISVREYAKLIKSSPPKASKELKNFENEGILKREEKGIYHYYTINSNSYLFKEFSKLYWYKILYNVTEKLHEDILFNNIILFGSLAKSENTKDSDVDLYLDISRREVDLNEIEKKLKRTVELHFKSELKNINLKRNIEKGVVIR